MKARASTCEGMRWPLAAFLILFVAMNSPSDALVGFAAAQDAPAPCGPFGVVVAGPASATAAGETATVTATITNDGTPSATVTIGAVVQGSEWALTSAQQQTLTIASGASATATFTVQANADAKTSATINLSGQADCAPTQLPTGCPNAQLCVAQLPPRSVTLDLEAPSGFRFPGLNNVDFPPEYLIAGLVLILIGIAIPFLVRRRKPAGVQLSVPEPLKRVKAGSSVSFPIEFNNPTDQASKLALHVGTLPHGWSALLPMPEVQLAAREARGLWVMVRSPVDAAAGAAADVELVATDAKGQRRHVKMRAEVDAAATAQG